MTQKIRDAVVKVGEYEDPVSREKKGRYRNVGALMKTDEGNTFLLLDPTFNPAGVDRGGNDSVMVNLFQPNNDRGGNQGGGDQGSQGGGGGGGQGGGGQSASGQPDQDFEDDIPFVRIASGCAVGRSWRVKF